MARAQGSGSVFQRASDGMWIARVELPSPDGTRRRKQVARARKADAVAALRELRRELDRAGDLPTSSPSVATWADLWFPRHARTLKPRTATTYRMYLDRYIVPTIGRVRLDKVTPAHVYRVHDAIAAAGLSSTTALQAHAILRVMLRDAEREGRIGRNPVELAAAPRRALNVRPALTAEQALTLLAHLERAGDPYLVHAAIALLTGLRQGERLGITAGAVDLDAGVLTVEWQVQRLTWTHGCGDRQGEAWPCGRRRGGSCPERRIDIPPDQEAVHLTGGLWRTRPKSRAGWREFPIGALPRVVDLLSALPWPAEPTGLVLTRGDGRPIDPGDDARAWTAALESAGLPPVPLHSARHTCSTLLAYLGVPEHVRMQILGHSSATVTRGYTHLTSAEAREGVARLGQLLDWREVP